MFEPTSAVIVALPAVLLSKNFMKPAWKPVVSVARPAVIVAWPAVLVPWKFALPKPVTLIIAGPAVLELVKTIVEALSLNVGALVGLMAPMPLPVIVT